MNYLDYIKDYIRFSNRSKGRFTLLFKEGRAILTERTKQTQFDRHYIYHPAWAARILSKTKPSFHIDIASALSFSTILSAFMPVRFYDYRPANLVLTGLTTGAVDLTALHFKSNSIQSLSCMHTVEHIGLGRYGDPINPDGDLEAIAELQRVIKPEGTLLFVVPIGKPKIVFNAHRIYSVKQVLSYFPQMELKELAVIPDSRFGEGLVINPTRRFCDKQSYACGCFYFQKKKR